MRRYLYFSLGVIALYTIFGTVARPIYAQGVYESVTAEDDGGVGNIETEVDGYGGGCPNSATVWSNLDGVFGSGVQVIQNAPLFDGVSYVWQWGFTVHFTNPYTGYCDSYSESFTDLLDTHTTYYGDPEFVGGNCLYNTLACEAGTSPYCPGTLPQFCPGFNTPFGGKCSDYMHATWVTLLGTCMGCFGASRTDNGACD